jgi:ABC-type polysaccharide/polyol phosphate export permease
MELGPEPGTLRDWVRSMIEHRDALVVLAAKDFKVRYKRATFGVLWAVALPLLQSAVMIAVFSRVGRFQEPGFDYTGYVLAGMVGWAYATATIPNAATAIVDGASLTDKVWFPRALLVLSPVGANLIGLVISLALIGGVAAVRTGIRVQMLLVVPGVLLLVALVSGFCLLAAALHVTFRDVRFIVQAGLLVLFYATPILYPVRLLDDLTTTVSIANPMVGVVGLFQSALSTTDPSATAVIASVVWTVALLALSVRLHHRRDRLFVDLL